MNISRVATSSLALAIAVFVLGNATPSFAAKPVCDPPEVPPHPSCKDDSGSGDTETVFLVEMQRGTLDAGTLGLVTTEPKCGSTEGELHLGAVFPDDCAVTVVYFMSDPTGGPLPLHLWYAAVRFNRSDVQLFFRTKNLAGMYTGIYVSDRLAATINRDGSSSSPFTVDVNLSKLEVEKNHQPDKGDLVGPIAIGKIVYTPVE